MKKLNLINKVAVAFAMMGLLMCVNMQLAYGQSGVGINTTDAAANANAMLDVQSTTKGVLLTPMTAAQANTAFGSSLSVAAQGLTVYITSGSAGPFTSSGYWYNTSSTTTPNWVSVGNGSVTLVATGYGLTGGPITTSGTLSADTTAYATSAHSGFLKYNDWATFNAKQNALATGNLTDAGTDGITVTNGTGSVIGSGTSITQQKADASHNGYLSSSDWTTFNSKGTGDGSVTSVSAGYGTNFSTITTTGSIVADTSILINKTGTQTLTNKTISGSSNTVTNIGNSSLTNSSVTVSPGVDLTGGGAISLGSSVTLNADTTQNATSTHSGFLKYADWTTFNSKQNALSLGTGVATALGMAVTGSGGIVLATSPTLTTPVLGAATATSVNGLTLTANSVGFAMAGGTTSKTLTVSNTLTLAGNDGSTLNIGGGGTLGSNAYTSTAYAPLASPTFTGTVTIPTPFTLGSTSVTSTGTQLNYLNAATGTTGTTSSNMVFSASPTFTGTPAAPTATAGTSTTQIATTAFVATNFAPTGTLIARKIITSGTTVSIDAGTNAILVELIGGGGGGGGANGASSKTDCGSGGGAGGYTSYYLSGPASSYACVIGGGGSGGPNTGGAGSDGQSTTITVGGTTISANGGHKGTNTGQVNNPFSVAGGAGASAGSNGTFMSGGAPGEIGLCTGVNTGGGGNGGSSVYGGGGLGPVVSTSTSNGANATGYGGGGGGSASGTSGTGGTGGNGAGGCIIVWEYR